MMNTQPDDQTSNMNISAEQLLSVGKTLREARENLGMSVNDVANRIKFAPRQIESLEADDYVRLPEAAFVRGFVRSYARLLELDPARLLAGLPSSHTQSSATQEVKSVDVAMPTASSARRYNVMLLAAGLAIALVVAIFERMHDRSPEQPESVLKSNVQVLELPNVSTESGVAQTPEQLQPLTPAPQGVVGVTPVAPQPLPRQPARAAPALPQQAQQAVASPTARPVGIPATQQPVPPRAVRAEPVPVTAKPAAAVGEEPKVNSEMNASEHALRMEFDEDAWIEVKDGGGNVLISKMRTKGSLVRVAGKAPLLVIIGNARAVRLFDNGKKINLERYTTADVARVTLK